MINFDHIITKNIKEHNPKLAGIPDHPNGMVTVDGC